MLIGVKNSDDHYFILFYLSKEFKLENKLIFYSINFQILKLFHI
jgi:hypothetical protein